MLYICLAASVLSILVNLVVLCCIRLLFIRGFVKPVQNAVIQRIASGQPKQDTLAKMRANSHDY